jgi:broad specificity phosphatase PhoE
MIQEPDLNFIALVQLWLVRHGETEWSASGRHTGSTDLPLTRAGEQHAREIGRVLTGRRFALVLTSPLQRASETCRLAGYGDIASVESNLREWDYGEYEGRTTSEIKSERLLGLCGEMECRRERPSGRLLQGLRQ